jgi:cellulose biosynthesis protein BcsQ
VFEAADILLVPTIPTTLSLRTLDQLRTFCAERGLDSLKLLTFFSMVDRRKTMHRDILEQLSIECPGLLKTDIPYASEVEQMGVHCAPVTKFATSSRAGQAFVALWSELVTHLGKD